MQAASGTPLTIHGVGTQKRQFTYVGDVAELIAQAAFLKQREFHVINIGSDEINSVSELVTEVEAVSGHTLDVSRGGESTGTYHVQVRLLPSQTACVSVQGQRRGGGCCVLSHLDNLHGGCYVKLCSSSKCVSMCLFVVYMFRVAT